MRMVLLGAVRAVEEECWKDHIAYAGQELGWSVTHLNARNTPVTDVIRECSDADIFIWARTHGHEPMGNAWEMIHEIASKGTATVGLHFDLYWGVPAREKRLGAPWLNCQYVLTADGGHEDGWAKLEINHVWCPPAMSDHFFGRAEPSGKYKHSAVFVGGIVPDIHGAHRKDLLAWANRRWGAGFAHYGMGRNRIYGSRANDLYASVPIIVGDSAFSPSRYWSDRVPRTLGRGGVLCHPEVEGMKQNGFIDGETLITYPRGDFETLGVKLDSLTSKDLKQISDNALQVIRERHLWTYRLQQIQRLVRP